MLTQEVIISARRLNKTFIGENKRPTPVLRDVSLTVHAGEFVTILGQSGSGKSTLLRMLAGLIPPDSGTLTLAGKPINGPSANAGMVFQSYALYPWLTVYDNIAFGLLAQRLPPQTIAERLGALLRLGGAAAAHPGTSPADRVAAVLRFDRFYHHRRSQRLSQLPGGRIPAGDAARRSDPGQRASVRHRHFPRRHQRQAGLLIYGGAPPSGAPFYFAVIYFHRIYRHQNRLFYFLNIAIKK